MTKKTKSTKIMRHCLPRRSKSQFYMTILPLLPDFQIIVRNIDRIRKRQEKSRSHRKAEIKSENKKDSNSQEDREESPHKILECPEPATAIQEKAKDCKYFTQEQLPLQQEIVVGKIKSIERKRSKIHKRREGKSKDQLSFTYFNSIEEYFL